MYAKYLEILRRDLPLGESFDILERKIVVGGHDASIFFVDGLTDGTKTQYILNYLLSIKEKDMNNVISSKQFLEEKLPYLDSHLVSDIKLAEQRIYSGLSLMVIESFDQMIVMDTREYPGRSVEEPDKEKSLRGAKDGFTENFMENVSLIRRRIRDNNLIMKYFPVGEVSKTDIAIAYMKDQMQKI